MIRAIPVILLALPAALAASVTPSKAPTAEFETATAMEDIERCLMDLPGWPAPIVYRQPDRPNDVALVWTVDPGRVTSRVEMRRSEKVTKVRSWIPEKSMRSCVR